MKAFAYCTDHTGARGALFVPVYKDIERIILPTFHDWFGDQEGKMWIYRASGPDILFPQHDAIIFLGSAENPERARGMTLAFFWLDEGRSEGQEEVFKRLQPCLTQRGYPHQGWVTSTPRGRRNWLYKRWFLRQNDDGEPLPEEEYPVWLAKTQDNFHLKPKLYESLRQSLGGLEARQELEGEFVDMEGQAFPQFAESIHVRESLSNSWQRRLVGVDFGLASPTAAVDIGIALDGTAWVLREFYKRQCDLDELIGVLHEWQAPAVICDPTFKDTIITLRKAGIPARAARSNKFDYRHQIISQRLQRSVQGLAGGLYIVPGCPNVIEELAGLSWAQSRSGDWETDKFSKAVRDDAHDALAYALMETQGLYGLRPRGYQLIRT